MCEALGSTTSRTNLTTLKQLNLCTIPHFLLSSETPF